MNLLKEFITSENARHLIALSNCLTLNCVKSSLMKLLTMILVEIFVWKMQLHSDVCFSYRKKVNENIERIVYLLEATNKT